MEIDIEELRQNVEGIDMKMLVEPENGIIFITNSYANKLLVISSHILKNILNVEYSKFALIDAESEDDVTQEFVKADDTLDLMKTVVRFLG